MNQCQTSKLQFLEHQQSNRINSSMSHRDFQHHLPPAPLQWTSHLQMGQVNDSQMYRILYAHLQILQPESPKFLVEHRCEYGGFRNRQECWKFLSQERIFYDCDVSIKLLICIYYPVHKVLLCGRLNLPIALIHSIRLL